jgi:hypothetical protein
MIYHYIITLIIIVFATGCELESPDENDKPDDLFHPQLYSQDSPFNQKVPDNVEIDPNSDLLVKSIIDQTGSHGFFIAVNGWTSPVFYTDNNTPRHDVALTVSWAPYRTMKNVPIPDFAEPDPEGDGTMVIIDMAAGCEYDFWQAVKGNDETWSASWGNAIKIESDGIFQKGLSARGSGFAVPAGMIWPDELADGEINHALVFSYDHTKAGGPVPPATESDGTSLRADAIPEGALVQLDPDLDLNSLELTSYEKTIAKALQEYGMFLVDDGGGVQLQAISPLSVKDNPYKDILPENDYVYLDNIPVERFRIIKLGDQNPDPEIQVVDVGCVEME